MDGHAVSPFDLSQTLPVGGGLLVPYEYEVSQRGVVRGSTLTETAHPGQAL